MTLAAVRRFLAALPFACIAPCVLAQTVVDAWAPAASSPPFGLYVADPVQGNVLFPPVHATLLPDGRVVLFNKGGLPRAAWFRPGPPEQDPPGGAIELTAEHVPAGIDQPISFTDAEGKQHYLEETLFCSGHSLMADGSLFVAGGTLLHVVYDPVERERYDYIYGMPDATLRSAFTNSWWWIGNLIGSGATNSVMRWYGTVTRLADSRMLVSAGAELAGYFERHFDANGNQTEVHFHLGSRNNSIETWLPSAVPERVVSPHGETPELIWNPDYTHTFTFPYGPPIFPANFVLMFGGAGVPVYFSPDAPPGSRWFPQTDKPRPGTVPADVMPNHGASSVLLPMRAVNFEWGYANGSVLQAGGGRESTMERSIDLFEPLRGWIAATDLGVRRRYPATVLLPDGKVLIVSGYDATGTSPVIRNAHYLDPRPPASFANGATASGEVRGYHNVALLLPDGRVFVAGGRSLGSDLNDPADEKPTFRYLYPPYLSPREAPPPRPAITAAPATIGYGASFAVGFSGGPVSEVVLMGLGSMTHAFDTNQRYIQLATGTQGAGTIQVTGPADRQTAPPGPYMLFVLDANRVPSVARFVALAP